MLDKVLEYLDKPENKIFIKNVFTNNSNVDLRTIINNSNVNINNITVSFDDSIDCETIIFNLRMHLKQIIDDINIPELEKLNFENNSKNTYFSINKEFVSKDLFNMMSINFNDLLLDVICYYIEENKIFFEEKYMNIIFLLLNEIRKGIYFSIDITDIAKYVMYHIIGDTKITNIIYNEDIFRYKIVNSKLGFEYTYLKEFFNQINTLIGKDSIFMCDNFIITNKVEQEFIDFLSKINIVFNIKNNISYCYFPSIGDNIIFKNDGKFIGNEIDSSHFKWKNILAVKRKQKIKSLLC